MYELCVALILTMQRTIIFVWPLYIFLAPAVTVGETEGAMDSPSVFFLPLFLPITL